MANSTVKWNPEDYNKNSSQLTIWAKGLLAALCLNGNEKILDAGSGDGKITAEISKLVPYGSVVGIDSSTEMIEFSGKNFGKGLYPNLEFRRMDIREISYKKYFDVVFSTATLHWLTDHLQVLGQFKNCLKDGGRIFLQMGGKDNQKELLEVLDKVKQNSRWSGFFSGFDFRYGYYGPDEYEEWLKATGFTAKRIELVKKDNALNEKEGLCSWIRLAFSPYVQKLPDGLQTDFINSIADDYLETHAPDENGICHIGMIRLEVDAVL